MLERATTKEVIILGAGISGLVCALLLKMKNPDLKFKLFEQRKEFGNIGGALSIWPNGTKVLMDLPCAEQIKTLKKDLIYELWGNAEGETLRTVARKDLLQINGYPLMNVCRSELQQVLLKTLGEDGVLFDKKAKHIEQTDNNATVFFHDGTSATADLVIGADGTFSAIRRSIFPEAKLQYTGYISLVGIFPAIANQKHHFIWGQNRLCINFPTSDERHLIYTIRPAQSGVLQKNLNSREKQINAFRGWSDEVDSLLNDLEQSLQNPSFAQHYYCTENYDMPQLPHVHQNRVVLIGDAAHPNGSIAGLNANLGLEDADLLTSLLQIEPDIRTALQRFSQEQLSRITAITNLESEKKEFFLNMTEEDYVEFQQFTRSASSYDFLSQFISALTNVPNVTAQPETEKRLHLSYH